MKKIITSASIAALSTVGIHAALSPGMSSKETSKWWTVSCSLRGFYDDNVATQPSGPLKEDSFGIQVSPSLNLTHFSDQTTASLGYRYDMRWYEDRDSSADHNHAIDGRLNHAFSENYRLDLSDSFAIAQEPELLAPGGVQRTRTKGDNYRNFATIRFNAELTRLFGIEVGYSNNLFDYDQSGPDSYSAYLDRMEHLPYLHLRYRVLPQTIAILGYQYGIVNQTSDDPITGMGNPEVRDRRSHYMYVGVDQTFASQISGAIRLGAQYTEYPNADQALVQLDDANWSPYADASVKYVYRAGSYAQLGVRHMVSQSEYYSLDEQDTTVYGNVSHQITPKLTANLLGQYTHADFNGGLIDGLNEDYFVVGVNLAYQINQFLVAETGYNYDDLGSDIPSRDYNRNRVYIGITASY